MFNGTDADESGIPKYEFHGLTSDLKMVTCLLLSTSDTLYVALLQGQIESWQAYFI